jgi:hypothetical protein
MGSRMIGVQEISVSYDPVRGARGQVKLGGRSLRVPIFGKRQPKVRKNWITLGFSLKLYQSSDQVRFDHLRIALAQECRVLVG